MLKLPKLIEVLKYQLSKIPFTNRPIEGGATDSITRLGSQGAYNQTMMEIMKLLALLLGRKGRKGVEINNAGDAVNLMGLEFSIRPRVPTTL